MPVRVFEPNTPILCDVFVDFDPGSDNSALRRRAARPLVPTRCFRRSTAASPDDVHPSQTASRTVVDPNACHTIQCFVANAFDVRLAQHTPGDSLGADSVDLAVRSERTRRAAPSSTRATERSPPDAPLDGAAGDSRMTCRGLMLRADRGSRGGAPLLAVALACEPIVRRSGAGRADQRVPCAPVRRVHTQPGTARVHTRRLHGDAAPTTNLLLVIGLATDSYLAPGGRTSRPSMGGAFRRRRHRATCALPTSAAPPLRSARCRSGSLDQDDGYSVSIVRRERKPTGTSARQREHDWRPRRFPVQATYRRLIGPSAQDALDLGLPVEPVQGQNVTTVAGRRRGPNGSPQIAVPDVPAARLLRADAAAVRAVSRRRSRPRSSRGRPASPHWRPSCSFDVTPRRDRICPPDGPPTVPQFDIRRAEGLDGWTAYLRDVADEARLLERGAARGVARATA